MQWISQMKSRVLDVFRGIDRDQDGRISQREFIESVLSSSECPGAGPGAFYPPREPGKGQRGEMWGSAGRDGEGEGLPALRAGPGFGAGTGWPRHRAWWAEGPLLSPEFPTNVLEMNAVASIFDMNGDGFIDYYEFVSALHPNRDPLRRTADADQIQDEVRCGGRGGWDRAGWGSPPWV